MSIHPIAPLMSFVEVRAAKPDVVCGPIAEPCRRVDRLAGYFVGSRGTIEPSLWMAGTGGSILGHADPGVARRSEFTGGKLSENEALDYLKRVPSETGQLVVRAADGLTTAWFAGIGDADDLFVELRPLDAWTDRDEIVMGTMCPLVEAEELLRAMFRGEAPGVPCGAGGLPRRCPSSGPEPTLVGEVDDGA